MSVIAAWRNRPRALRGELLRCGACGTFASVQRAKCARCGGSMSEAKTEPLPRRFRTAGYSHSHTAIEVMDQTGAQAPFVLADAGNGQLFALALCESDAGDGPRLVGEELELVLRRRAGDIGPGDAIRYVRKLAASAATRRKFKNQTKVEGRKP